MAITTVQNWTVATKSDGTGSVTTNTLASIPVAGNLLVAWASTGDGGGVATGFALADTIGDGVSWTPMGFNPVGMGAQDVG